MLDSQTPTLLFRYKFTADIRVSILSSGHRRPRLIDGAVVVIECVSPVKGGQTSAYSAVYRVCVCSCVRRRPQSFIKGSTLKGQLNYSLLTGGGGGCGGDGWHGDVAT